MHRMSLLVLYACSGAPSETGAAGETGATDTAGELVSLEEARGRYEQVDGTWIAVRLDGPNPMGILLSVPDAARYSAGLPVAIEATGGLEIDPGCGGGAPPGKEPTEAGVLTARPIGPGFCCEGVCSAGVNDFGGEDTQRGVNDTLSFLLGQGQTTLGDTIYDLVPDHEILNEQIALVVSSGSAAPVLAALARQTALEALSGIGVYEAPIYPAITAGQLGRLDLDPDLETDGDGNGFVWDDGRNPRYEIGDCALEGCALDVDELVWEPIPESESSGIFLDGNGDGRMTAMDGTIDLDGDGALGLDEDFPMNSSYILDGQEMLPPRFLQDAIALGRLDPADWPPGVADLGTAQTFWGDRDPLSAVGRIHTTRPDLTWLVMASQRDHGAPLSTRPHIVGLYLRLDELGARVGLNPTREQLEALDGDLEEYKYEHRDWNAPLTEQDIHENHHLVPMIVGRPYVRAAGMAQMLDEAWLKP